ncbi:MAG: hypothetical protein H8E34_03630 [Bacteroidetes bacterium]|nr:hypothetical protein [Bacteroidota bacterium]MBL6944637.1 hypothetical protein [Bacteroidales bacterium]
MRFFTLFRITVTSMFCKALLISLIVLTGTQHLSGQIFVGNDYRILDSVTYTHYINHDWEKVIYTGDRALNKNIDYYYLRMRMGIAAYYLGRLPEAADHFEKALIFNSKDQTAQLYLYDTYKLLGKNTRAYRLGMSFSNNTLSLIPEKRKPVEALYAGGGYSFSNNFALNDKFIINNTDDTLAGSQILIGDKSDFYAGVNFNLSPVVSLYAGYNRLQIQKKISFQYIEAPIVLDSVQREDWGFQNFFSNDPEFFRKSFDETIKQDEIYLNSRFQFETGWAITLFSNLVMVKSVNIKADTVQTSVTDTSYYVIGNSPEFITYTYDELQFTRTDSSFFNYVFGVNIEKDYNNITFNLNGSISSLNGLNQNQLGISAFYYLNKHASFYGASGLTWFAQRWDDGWNENRLIINQKLGSKLYRRLWGEVDLTIGNLNNANISNGFVVYNQADKMRFKGGLTFKIFIGKHMELNLLYQYIAYEGIFNEISDEGANQNQNNNLINNTFNYQTPSIFGGLKWKF